MSIRRRSNRISRSIGPLRLRHVLARTLLVQAQGRWIRCEPCSLALSRITYTLGRCLYSSVSCGWCIIYGVWGI